MRVSVQHQLRTVPGLVLALLLAAPIVAAAAGVPTITMYPETAGPGATIEVTGIDFPPGREVQLMLATPDGTVPLTSALASATGDFREIVALPPTARGGAWQLQAVGGDGAVAGVSFVTDADAAAVAAAAAAAAAAQTTTSGGNSGADNMFLLVLGVLLGAIAIGAMVAYRQFKDTSPPGMGKGDDLIWGSGPLSPGPELTATDEPHWKAHPAQGEG
jgi:hypothetical protein